MGEPRNFKIFNKTSEEKITLQLFKSKNNLELTANDHKTKALMLTHPSVYLKPSVSSQRNEHQ